MQCVSYRSIHTLRFDTTIPLIWKEIRAPLVKRERQIPCNPYYQTIRVSLFERGVKITMFRKYTDFVVCMPLRFFYFWTFPLSPVWELGKKNVTYPLFAPSKIFVDFARRDQQCNKLTDRDPSQIHRQSRRIRPVFPPYFFSGEALPTVSAWNSASLKFYGSALSVFARIAPLQPGNKRVHTKQAGSQRVKYVFT